MKVGDRINIYETNESGFKAWTSNPNLIVKEFEEINPIGKLNIYSIPGNNSIKHVATMVIKKLK